jgi:hypothetical protein
MGLAVLNAERVWGYADQWRSLARGWARLAGNEHGPRAAKLRHAAQMALYAAHEAEQLLKTCWADGLATTPIPAPAPVARMLPKPVVASAERQRHGPIGYLGPIALAGRKSVSMSRRR